MKPAPLNSSLRLLRLFLGFSAVAWGVSVAGVFAPWGLAVQILRGLGAQPIEYDPMLDYWLRMASGAFFLVGCLFALFALKPARYQAVIPAFGWLMAAEGLILLGHGARLGLAPFPFWADAAACLAGGAGILICARRAFHHKPLQVY